VIRRLVVLKRSFTVSLRLLDVLSGLCVGVVCCFGLFCLWTSSLLHYLFSHSLRTVDRPCHELDRQTLLKKNFSFLSTSSREWNLVGCYEQRRKGSWTLSEPLVKDSSLAVGWVPARTWTTLWLNEWVRSTLCLKMKASR